MKIALFIFPVALFALLSGCDTPTEGFDRTNSSDPLSQSFSGGTVSGLNISADTSGAITIRWAESASIVTINVLEKSLGDTLNFTPIAELDPDQRNHVDSSLEVRKETYYRLSSFIELEGEEDVLYGRSQTKLEFGEISNERVDFLSESNRLQLSWKTDTPFFTHFIISSENVISEDQDKSVKIPADGIRHKFEDPLVDIDFETRKYTISGIIEQNGGIEEEVTHADISFDTESFFQPENIEIEIINEQDWKITWDGAPFFATEVELTRLIFEENIKYSLPPGEASFIDSLIIEDSQGSRVNQFRRYGVRFLTETGSSRQIEHFDDFDVGQPVIAGSNMIQDDPNSLKIFWASFGNNTELIKEYIIEKPHPFFPEEFVEVARVVGDGQRQFTDTNVDEFENPVYRVRTVTSYPSEPASFTYSHDYEVDYAFGTGMNYVTSMELSSGKKYLAAVSFRSDLGNSILITDIESKQTVSEISIPSQQISDIKISPDDSSIYFSVPTDGAIYKADFPTGHNIEKIIDDARVNLASVFHIDLSSDGSFLIGTGGQGFVKRWNLPSYEMEFFSANTSSPTFYTYKNIAISPDGNFVGGNNGSNYIMDAKDGTFRESLPWSSANMTDAQFSADGNYYSFVPNFRSTLIYSTVSWELAGRISSGNRAGFHPENPVMVLSNRNRVFTYDIEKSSILDIVSEENGNQPNARYENKIIYIDDDRIGTVAGTGTIQIWKKKGTQRRWKNAN